MFAERGRRVRAATALALPGLLWTCLSVRDEARQEQNACATCHGDVDANGDPLLQAAPPRDLLGNTSPAYPGVGAHQAHLTATEVHAAMACAECHVVPGASDSPGHADSAPPAELSFGALARAGGARPAYDPLARRCADTHCHGPLSPPWTESAAEPCGGCHGLPPNPPHPQSERCSVCHSAVIDPERRVIAAARHVDGHTDLDPIACHGCHGSPESAAPPPSLGAETSASLPGVGAHQAHLGGGAQSRPLACSECHPVPEAAQPFRHPEGGAVTLAFSGVGRSAGRAPAWDAALGGCADTWCHDPSGTAGDAVSWTRGAPLACTDCHGLPPAAPHPQVQDCSLCHADVGARAEPAITNRQRHVDGVVDVQVPSACTGCHASDRVDASAGGLAAAAPDVGAHAAHLAPRGAARPVSCGECHLVPGQVFAAGHVDSPAPVEVLFSGVARAFEAEPSYAAGTCAQTYCHGDSFIGARPSGGLDTVPRWLTAGSVSALTCQSCHGMPPPAPHPAASECSSCHQNVDAMQHFIAPATHVDGVVTFFLP